MAEQRIHVNQPFTLKVDTNTVLTDTDVDAIAYRSPVSRTEGTIAAQVSGTKLQASTSFDEAGEYELHAYPTFTGDSNPSPGKIAILRIYGLYER